MRDIQICLNEYLWELYKVSLKTDLLKQNKWRHVLSVLLQDMFLITYIDESVDHLFQK